MDSRINTIYPKSGKTFETLLKLQLFYNLFYCIIQVDLVPGYYVIFAILGCFVFFKMLCNVRLDGGAFSHSFWTCFILYVLYSLFIVTNFNGDYSINTIQIYIYTFRNNILSCSFSNVTLCKYQIFTYIE